MYLFLVPVVETSVAFLIRISTLELQIAITSAASYVVRCIAYTMLHGQDFFGPTESAFHIFAVWVEVRTAVAARRAFIMDAIAHRD
jgi:hypothetical protein